MRKYLTNIKNFAFLETNLENNMTSMEETVYEVEQIDDDREIKGKKQYFIKWRNFPVSDNTWEPEENLDCPDLIARYEEAKKQRSSMVGSASGTEIFIK